MVSSGARAKNKGSGGEREACEWLGKHVGLLGLERNIDQVRHGGHDIDAEPFLVEVKRVEVRDLNVRPFDKWWMQIKAADLKFVDDRIPIVMFRLNKRDWEFLIPFGNGWAHIKHHQFISWAEYVIEQYAATGRV